MLEERVFRMCYEDFVRVPEAQLRRLAEGWDRDRIQQAMV